MKKIFVLIISALLAVTLVSCTKDIPEGDIKKFVDQIDYREAYAAINSAKGVTKTTYYINKKEQGSLISTTIIDKNAGEYCFKDDIVTGSYYGNTEGTYDFYNRKTLCYIDSNKNGIVYELKDNKLNPNIKYSPEDVALSLRNFFYTKLEANYHMGGYYYGDYVKANCAKYYEYFSLNEEKTLLTYKINTLTENSNKEEILTLHEFVINKYGMIVSLSSTAKNNSQGIKNVTTMECEYNLPVEKLVELKEEDKK